MQNKYVGNEGYVIGSDGKPDLRTRYRIKRVYRDGVLLLVALKPNGTLRDEHDGRDKLRVDPLYFTATSALVKKPAVRSA